MSQLSPCNRANSATEAASHDTVQNSRGVISKNPFCRNLTPLGPIIQRSTSEETQSSLSGRVKPVRAVFHDLPTAHSSITSGSARSRTRSRTRRLSNSHSEACEEEDSILLQELDSPQYTQARTKAFLDELPIPPPPAAIVQHRLNSFSYHSGSCLITEDEKLVSRQKSKQDKLALPDDCFAQPSSVFASVKNAFALSSSPATVTTPSKWPGSSRNRGKQRAKHPDNGSSIYHSGLGAAPSGSLPTSSANKPLLDPPRNHGYDSYNDVIPFPDLLSTPAAPGESSAVPRNSSKTTRVLSNAASSLPEGSTVGNIYKHYALSDPHEDFDSGSDNAQSEHDLGNGYKINQHSYDMEDGVYSGLFSSDQGQQIILQNRKQRRAERASSNWFGQPPGFSLPSLPKPSARMLQSNSQGIANSSSYGDTHNLLDLNEPAHWVGREAASRGLKNAIEHMSDQDSSDIGNSSGPGISHLNPNNPFRVNRAPQILVSQTNVEEYGHADRTDYIRGTDRQPLEREVSEALRRASNFSAYSNGSISNSALEHFAQFQANDPSSNRMGLLTQHLEYSPPSDPDVLGEETRVAAAPTQAFYEKGAIPSSNWLASQQNEVRIPIKQIEQLLNSPPISPEDQEILAHHNQDNLVDLQEDDGNDWETVGESVFGIDRMLGDGFAKQAGSSIADTSDEGSTSTYIPEISDYGSTERIAQHPASDNYRGNYRQRDLKNTQLPVFLPVYREHKVNGYLADSNRTRPPPNFYEQNPTLLNRKHTNPFNSPLPEVMRVGASKPFAHLNRGQRTTKPEQLPTPASITTYISSGDTMTPEHTAPTLQRSSRAMETPSRPMNWVDDFGDPGPQINFSRPHFLKPISPVAEENRPSSWQHMMIYAACGKVEGYDENGLRLLESPFGPEGGRGTMREHSLSNYPSSDANTARENTQTDGFVEQKTCGSKKALTNLRQHSTLVKGPPGAFYYGLARPKANRSQSHTAERPPKATDTYTQSSAKVYQTNALRPLALVSSRQQERPITPIDSSDPEPSDYATPNDFIYRSPLAPIKRSIWKKLYTPEQLTDIRDAAQADGIFDARTSQAVAFSDGLLDDPLQKDSSRKHLYESPRLFQWPREPSHLVTEERKRKISTIVLCLCNIFPPLLLVFALGGMDGFIKWWTDGDSDAFGRGQKRIAFILVLGWCLVTFTALVVFLILWFTHRSHRTT